MECNGGWSWMFTYDMVNNIHPIRTVIVSACNKRYCDIYACTCHIDQFTEIYSKWPLNIVYFQEIKIPGEPSTDITQWKLLDIYFSKDNKL